MPALQPEVDSSPTPADIRRYMKEAVRSPQKLPDGYSHELRVSTHWRPSLRLTTYAGYPVTYDDAVPADEVHFVPVPGT